MSVAERSVIVVGCGGVASYLLPALTKVVPPKSITLIDGDLIESKNFGRQFLNQNDLDLHKAESLGLWYGTSFVNDFVTDGWKPPKYSLIFTAVDNHPARKVVLAAADETQSIVIVGANEFNSAQSYIYLPEWKGTKRDPRVRYPEIVTVTDNDPTNPDCIIQAETYPQLAVYNNLAAGLMLQLFWTYAHDANGVDEDILSYEHSTNFNRWNSHALRKVARVTEKVLAEQ